MVQITAHILGFGAVVSLFLIYQQKNRKRILLCKLSADIFWILHYFVIGATAGMIPNFVGVFRECVFINRHRKWASHRIWVAVFIAINILLSILTFEIYYDAIPIIASSLVTISLWINNPDLTKKLSIPVTLLFLIYNIFVRSYVGMANEIISLMSIIVYFIRKGE